MNVLHHYSIPFGSLDLGTYTFNFLIDKKFFDQFEYSEVKEGNINVDVELRKAPQLLELEFAINGVVYIQCDRCLEYFHLPVQTNEVLYVKFGEEDSDITDVDEVLILAHTHSELPLAQHIYEYINLCLPVRRVHPDDANGNSTCNPEMLEKLEEYLSPEPEEDENTDPRWDKLKILLN